MPTSAHHFVALASTLRTHAKPAMPPLAYRKLCEAIARDCAMVNANFDHRRFLANCGLVGAESDEPHPCVGD